MTQTASHTETIARPAAPGRLVLSDIVCRFDGVPAVNGVSLSVAGGELVCLLGPSGCGKTTTLRAAAGIERPQSGESRIDGELACGPHTFLAPEERKVGLMFQDYALFPHLSVADNVMFGLKGMSRKDKRARARAMLKLVHMDRFEGAYPHTLSGGEQQRVALARALAPEPAIMLMDEPFSGLDKGLKEQVRGHTLKALAETGTATLMVTHDPEEAMRMADKIAVMRSGEIVQFDTPDQIYHHPADQYVAGLFGDVNILHATVAGGEAPTPLGRFPASHLADGTRVEVLVRPHDLRLGGGADAHVASSRLVGPIAEMDLVIDATGEHVTVRTPRGDAPAAGEAVAVYLSSPDSLVFPCMKRG